MIPTLAIVTAGFTITVILVTIALIGLVVLACRAIDEDSGEPDDGDSGSGGGGGSDRPGPGPGSGGDPAWWPEFEREFDRYTAGSVSR